MLGRRMGFENLPSQKRVTRWWTNAFVYALPLAMLLGGGWGTGCSCEDTSANQDGDIRLGETPKLEVRPQVITFAAATTERPETQTITLLNSGDGDLTAYKFSLQQDGNVFEFEPPADLVTLSPNRMVEMTVSYAPDDDITDTGVLVIEASNDQRAEVILNTVPPRRELQCEPEPAVFSGVAPGETDTIEIEITNIGTLPTTITDLTMDMGRVFTITNTPDLDLELRPEQSATIEVTFAPTEGGMEEDEIQILTDEMPGLFTCNVRGAVPLPVISVMPARIDFGAVAVGETVSETIVVSNEGDATLNLDAPQFLRGTSEDFGIEGEPSEEVALAPDEFAEFTFTYTASIDTPANGTAVFLSNDPITPQFSVPLLGRASVPDLVVTPESINYGNVAQTITVTRTFSMFNNGSEPVEIESMILDTPGEFEIVADAGFAPTTGGSGTIEPLGEAMVSVTYTPLDEGEDFGRILIASNDPDEPNQSVTLLAIGGGTPECRVSIRPDPVNFGLVTRGSEKILPVRLENLGNAPCTFGSAQAMGILNPFFSLAGVSHTSGQELLPGDAVILEVRYNPVSTNIVDNGILSVDVTNPHNNNEPLFCGIGDRCRNGGNPFECGFGMTPPPCSVNLTGLSGISDIAVIPGALDFGLVTLGCASQVTTVTVYNTGNADLNISDIRLDAQGCGEFELRAVPVLPTAVTPQAPIPIQVIYRPNDLGEDSCSLLIESDASESEPILRVPLRGEGTNISRQTDVFEQISGRKVDVLFAIDASGSMSEEQNNVARNLGAFLQTAELLENDFHIAVTHLDFEDQFLFDGVFYPPGQHMGVPSVLTRDSGDYLDLFERRVRLGATGGGPEAGLEATRLALSDPLTTRTNIACTQDADCENPYPICNLSGVCGGQNSGFLRDDASLEIIMVSDEEDQSPGTPSFYLDFLQNIKGFRNDALLHVSTIVGADLATNEPANCNSNNGSASAGQRYAVIAEATNGSVGSICNNNFGPFLQNIGNRAFGLRVEFFLSRAAEPATVEVRVNGEDRPMGWSYDEAANAVFFEIDSVPQPGDSIEISYEARCFQ